MDELAFPEALEELEQDPDRKHAYFHLCALYSMVDPKQRDFLRSEWLSKQTWTIPRFRAILLEDSYPSEQRLRACLLSLALFPSIDYRDDLVVICPLYHSAVHLGLNPQLLFEEIAVISDESTAQLLRAFCQRSQEDRALKAFGYKEEQTPDGLYFDDIQQQSVETMLSMMEALMGRLLTEEERESITASGRKDVRYTSIQPRK